MSYRRYHSQKNERRSYDPYNSVVSGSREIMVGQRGISVFRPVNQLKLHEAQVVFSSLASAFGPQARGHVDQKPLGVNLLQMREVVWNKTHLADIAVTDSLNEIYTSVNSIKRKLAVGVKSVELFGSKEAKIRPVCVTFVDDSTSELQKEREDIIEVLQDLSSSPNEAFKWMTATQPHLALGKINTSLANNGVDNLLDGIMSELPTELTLDRATLHNPVKRS